MVSFIYTRDFYRGVRYICRTGELARDFTVFNAGALLWLYNEKKWALAYILLGKLISSPS